jgi:lipoprotein-anchoring transpeptidase ErfK/SrfK
MARAASIVAPAALAVAALAGCGGGAEPAPVDGGLMTRPAATPEPVRPVPLAPAPAARPATPALPGPWATARITRRVAIRARPGGARVARVGPSTEFGGPRVMSVVRRRGGWLEVVVPERPNARAGWIPAAGVRIAATGISLRVDLSDRELAVRRGSRTIGRVRIGVGAPGHATPTGRFAVTDKLRMGGPGTTYGCCAIALSAHQAQLPQGWTGLDRIAVHGTQSPETIGTAASLGCMHASDGDLRRLMRIVPVGAPVFVRA